MDKPCKVVSIALASNQNALIKSMQEKPNKIDHRNLKDELEKIKKQVLETQKLHAEKLI